LKIPRQITAGDLQLKVMQKRGKNQAGWLRVVVEDAAQFFDGFPPRDCGDDGFLSQRMLSFPSFLAGNSHHLREVDSFPSVFQSGCLFQISNGKDLPEVVLTHFKKILF
jgi:hypothetical protein